MFILPYDDINPTRRKPYLTWFIIGLNVAVYVYLYWFLVPGAGNEQVQELFKQYQGCRPEVLFQQILRMPAGETYKTLFFFNYGLVPQNITTSNWQITNFLTSMFLHGGIGHLAGNMLFLWITGDNLEDRFGHVTYLAFYVFCGFVAAATQIAMQPGACVPMVGASGAIAGVMGAYMVLFPRSKIKVFFFVFPIFGPAWFLIDAIWWLGLWILFQFFYEFASQAPGGVAHWAHIGGFAAGVLVALIGRYSGFVEGGVAPEVIREQNRGGGFPRDRRWPGSGPGRRR